MARTRTHRTAETLQRLSSIDQLARVTNLLREIRSVVEGEKDSPAG